MFYNEEENEDYLTDKEIQEQGLDKVIENIYLRNGASEEYAQVTAPPREKMERKRQEKKEKKERIRAAKEEEKKRQAKLKEVEKEIKEKQGDFTDMGEKKKGKKEKVDASTQIIIALYLGCAIMAGVIFAMIKILK